MPHPKFTAKSPLKASQLNTLIDAINSTTTGSGDNTVSSSGAGTVIKHNSPPSFVYTPLLCQINSVGPAGEADFTDYRYWAKILINVNTSTTNKTKDTLDVQDKPYGEKIIAAFNLAEYTDATHNLNPGDYVIVLPVRFDKGAACAPILRYVIVQGGGDTLPTGEYQYHVYQMVSDSQGGWDFPRCHPIP